MQVKKIGVISDTHIPNASPTLPKAVYEAFCGVDMIIHAGDLVEMSVLEKLGEIAPVRAVAGNMDSGKVKKCLEQKETISVGGFRIGLIHGYGPPAKLVETVSKEFKDADVVIFGHSHLPLKEVIEKTLFFNPGSPTDRIFAPYKSVGILEIGDIIQGKIVRLS